MSWSGPGLLYIYQLYVIYKCAITLWILEISGVRPMVRTKSASPKRPRQSLPKSFVGVASPVNKDDRATDGGELRLVLTPGIIRTLSTRKKFVRALMEAVSTHIELTAKTGRATSIAVKFNPASQPQIISVKESRATTNSLGKSKLKPGLDKLDAALTVARERGRLRAAEILNGEDMLSANQFAKMLGVSRVTINVKRQRHELLGLDGAKRGFRFPVWQLDEDGKPFAEIPALFARFGESPWAIYRFLIQRHPELRGLSGLEALQRGLTQKVIETADGIASGNFS